MAFFRAFSSKSAVVLGRLLVTVLTATAGLAGAVPVAGVAPFTMGIDVAKSHKGRIESTGLYLPVIERNTTIPVSCETTVVTTVDGQKRMVVGIFQGEARLVKDNIRLGELNLPIPPAPAGDEGVAVRFTYDSSGLLEVEARVLSTETVKRVVIEGHEGALSAEEIEAKLQALAHLKVHPSDQAENRAVMARAERLYEERLGDERAEIALWIDEFRHLLERQNIADIIPFRIRFAEPLDRIHVSFSG